MSAVAAGDVIKLVTENRRERVLWRDRADARLVMIDIDAPSAPPVIRDGAVVADWLETGAAELIADPWARSVREEALSEAQRARRDAAWALIRPLVEAQPDVFRERIRASLVADVVTRTGASRFTVYRALRRFWQRGMTPNALLPDYAASGGRGRRKAVSEKKRGRPPVYGAEGLNVTDEVRAAFLAAVQRHYAKKRKINIAACHRRCLDDFWGDDVVDPETGKQKIIHRTPHPSLRQFRYWFEKENDVYALERKRRTPRVFDKETRPLLSTSRAEVMGPGDRYQIDATIADVYLVSRLNRTRIIGRPTLYVIIDVFSAMIVGLYVGLEPPSWVGAMTALANAAGDKVAYCRQFGIEISEADWPCQGLPSALLADRGEMLGHAADALVRNFNVRIENTAPYRADWKGLVEQQFRLLPAVFGPYTPGYVEPDFRERGAKDYRLDAVFTVEEFTALVINCVLYYNNDREISSYIRDRAMIADDVAPIPIEMWEWGQTVRSGAQRRFPEEQIRVCLMPTDKARVTGKGIVFRNIHYSCQEALTGRWFEKARTKGTWQVGISYDPRLMDTIYLHDEDGPFGFIPCGLTDRSAAWRGLSLWEIDEQRQRDRAAWGRHEPTQRQARSNLERTLQDAAEKATALRDAALSSGESDASRVRGIRENRAAERDMRRKEEAFTLKQAPGESPAKVLPFAVRKSISDYDEPSVADFRRDKDERDD
jgi:hypothetical protein